MSDLLPCPVCGKPAELHKTADGTDEYPDNGCFVVFCQDTYCAGNCAPERSTPDEAIAAWNEQAAHPEFRWHKSCCPNCGWSYADEQDFQQYLEHYQSLPEPPRWKRFFSADLMTYSAVFGIMNVLWLRLYCQTAGIEMSLLQNLLYAVPFTLLFLLPAAALRAALDALNSYRDSKFFHFD